MLRKTLSIIGLALIVSCVGTNPSVKTLAEYEEANHGLAKFRVEANSEYLIGPGDLLAIDVWKEPELSKQVAVRLDGKVSLPLVNDIKAAGLSCTELQSILMGKYKDYVEAPEVSVTLLESRSKKIYLVGKVANPGEYPLQKDMTILQAISRAGGLDRWADTSDIRLIRKINEIEKTFTVDYDAIISGEDLSQNVLLQPDDTIFVP